MSSVATIKRNVVPPYLEVKGGCPLSGVLKVSGAKNSALALMAASLLTKEKLLIKNVPQLTDIEVMSEILRNLGAKLTKTNNSIEQVFSVLAPYLQDLEKQKFLYQVVAILEQDLLMNISMD